MNTHSALQYGKCTCVHEVGRRGEVDEEEGGGREHHQTTTAEPKCPQPSGVETDPPTLLSKKGDTVLLYK
jgi:hypothetical protein